MVRREIVVRCAPERAQRLFLSEVDAWWPPSHRLDDGRVALEGDLVVDRAGERSRQVARLVEDGPGRLVFDWFLGASEGRPSRVEVRFDAIGDPAAPGTLVAVAHGPGAMTDDEWRGTNARFEAGWGALGAAFAAWVAG